MAPDPMREPRGIPEVIRARDSEITRASKQRQHEAARVLAKAGYDVEQQPPFDSTDRMRNPWLKDTRRPDYRIEGEIFDALAPRPGTPAKNIVSRIRVEKINAGQARRIVLNLDDATFTLNELHDAIGEAVRHPARSLQDLQEVIVVRDGEVIPFYPER